MTVDPKTQKRCRKIRAQSMSNIFTQFGFSLTTRKHQSFLSVHLCSQQVN